ncbi:hypothetical protein NDU88_003571 [Pleurodeles waltl]|uniref:Uncharacterized protein n=1 Tax=Pleurodeles waltl TaxID=8319 RepID=A0AAV7W7D0_PLEWA|nr:hypothetical protein NDU88_003571 [Pleurodeles waltl]
MRRTCAPKPETTAPQLSQCVTTAGDDPAPGMYLGPLASVGPSIASRRAWHWAAVRPGRENQLLRAEPWLPLVPGPGMAGPGLRVTVAQREPGASPDTSVATIVATHTERFEDILHAVQSIKSTLEPKIDALRIDVGTCGRSLRN